MNRVTRQERTIGSFRKSNSKRPREAILSDPTNDGNPCTTQRDANTYFETSSAFKCGWTIR